METASFRSALVSGLAALLLAGGLRAAEPSAGVTSPVPARSSPSALSPGWQHGAFVEIYVRGYADGNGDGVGDLQGLVGRLDYLQSLGVRGLWLMPVTRSADRDHGYAVADYRDIEPDYGTLADFDELIAQAHRRGIGVIVDYVINHSADRHPIFQAAAADEASPWRQWYVWRDPAPSGWKTWDKDPWVRTPKGSYFATFSANMPDFDLQNPAVMAWHADNLRFWLNRGVDGFRFDAVAHLVERDALQWRDQPENFALMREAARVVHSYPNRYIVCEATREESRWASEEGCGGAFAIWQAPSFAKAAKGSFQAVQDLAKFFADAPPGMATMVSNHDLFAGQRLWDQVGGDTRAYKLAAAGYLLAGGTPFVYYGEEIGMSGAPSLEGDPRVRTPMSWNAQGFGAAKPFRALAGNAATQNARAEEGSGDSLLSWYRGLIALRNEVPALARGRHERGWTQGQVWGFRRVLGEAQAVVQINYGNAAQAAQLQGLGANRQCRLAFLDGRRAPQPREKLLAADERGEVEVSLPPRSVSVWTCAAR